VLFCVILCFFFVPNEAINRMDVVAVVVMVIGGVGLFDHRSDVICNLTSQAESWSCFHPTRVTCN
jgi:hypothetical protein